MQQRPDLSALLAAVERFLREELSGVIADERLRFRVLVAASLVAQSAAELGGEDQLLAEESAALRALLGAPPAEAGTGRNAARAALAALDAELAARIRRGEVDDTAARRHLLQALGAHLAVINPRFDRRLDVEEPR